MTLPHKTATAYYAHREIRQMNLDPFAFEKARWGRAGLRLVAVVWNVPGPVEMWFDEETGFELVRAED